MQSIHVAFDAAKSIAGLCQQEQLVVCRSRLT